MRGYHQSSALHIIIKLRNSVKSFIEINTPFALQSNRKFCITVFIDD